MEEGVHTVSLTDIALTCLAPSQPGIFDWELVLNTMKDHVPRLGVRNGGKGKDGGISHGSSERQELVLDILVPKQTPKVDMCVPTLS